MGVDPRTKVDEPGHEIVATPSCNRDLPYWSGGHEAVIGGDVHHIVVRDGETTVGHVVLNVDGETGGVYDMGVAPRSRRRGYGLLQR